jgi:hypothetical protein
MVNRGPGRHGRDSVGGGSVPRARLAPDPTGNVLAHLPTGAYRATLVAMPTGRPLGTTEGFADSLSAGADRVVVKVVSPLAWGGYCEWLRMIDRRAGRPLAIPGVETRISSVVIPFSHDGKHLAWGGTAGTFFVCDLEPARDRLASVQMGW